MVNTRVLLLALAGCLSACSANTNGGSPTAPSVSPSSRVARLTHDLSYAPRSHVAQLKLWANTVAWITPGDGHSSGDKIVVLDLLTHNERTVATQPVAHPLVAMSGDGDTVVFVELLGRPTQDAPLVNWQMTAVSLASGTATVIARSTAPVHYMLAPVPSIRLPWVAWAEPIPVPLGQRVDANVISYNMQTQRRVTLAQATGAVSGLAMSGTTVAYDTGRPPNYGDHDVYAQAVDGSSPATRLTTNGASKNPFAGGAWIGWEELGTGGAQLLGVPYDATSRKPGKSFAIDTTAEGNGKIGNSFALWLTFNGPLMFRQLPESAATPAVVVEPRATLDLAGSWDAWQDRLAWVTRTSTGAQTINLDTVTG